MSFGRAATADRHRAASENAVLELESEAMELPAERQRTVARQVCSDGQTALVVVLYGRHDRAAELSYGKTLVGSLLFRAGCRIAVSTKSMVGVLLPATVAGALVNIAILLAGKVPVNLNFTAGGESMAAAVRAMSNHHHHHFPAVFRQSRSRQPWPGMVFVEDIRKTFTARKNS